MFLKEQNDHETGMERPIEANAHHLICREPCQELAIAILQPVRFVDNTNSPWDFLQELAIGKNHFVRRDQGVELVEVRNAFSLKQRHTL